MVKNLAFPTRPFIYRYIQFDYDQATTASELIELYHKWQRVIDYTGNPVKKEAFKKALSALYSEITKRSFETKQFFEF
tara:strand:+ start:27629 stop:27862 length:234 start_codon:yes stop_codon:yes gene_type:complete